MQCIQQDTYLKLTRNYINQQEEKTSLWSNPDILAMLLSRFLGLIPTTQDYGYILLIYHRSKKAWWKCKYKELFSYIELHTSLLLHPSFYCLLIFIDNITMKWAGSTSDKGQWGLHRICQSIRGKHRSPSHLLVWLLTLSRAGVFPFPLSLVEGSVMSFWLVFFWEKSPGVWQHIPW